jgi:hypothetical protein
MSVVTAVPLHLPNKKNDGRIDGVNPGRGPDRIQHQSEMNLVFHGFDHRNFSIQRYVHNIGTFLGANANAITGLESVFYYRSFVKRAMRVLASTGAVVASPLGVETAAAESENDLHAEQHFVKLIVAELRIRLTKIRPGMDVIGHHFDAVAVDVVIQAARDGMDAIVAKLPWV